MFDEITTFSFPTRIVFGCCAIRELPKALIETGVRKPLIVTDPGLCATPVVGAVTGLLEQAGVAYEVFGRVHGNPIEEDVTESAALDRKSVV